MVDNGDSYVVEDDVVLVEVVWLLMGKVMWWKKMVIVWLLM